MEDECERNVNRNGSESAEKKEVVVYYEYEYDMTLHPQSTRSHESTCLMRTGCTTGGPCSERQSTTAVVLIGATRLRTTIGIGSLRGKNNRV